MTVTDTRFRIVLFVAGLLLGAETMQARSVPDATRAAEGETLDAAVRRNVASILLARRNVRVLDSERDVRWLRPPTGELGLFNAMQTQTFVALGVPPEAGTESTTRDLYRLTARVTPFGMVFDDGWIVNLTRTIQADDSALTVEGERVATLVLYQGRPTALEVRDFRGEDPEVVGTTDWGFWRRVGNAITNLEQTGQRRGLALNYYALDLSEVKSASAVSLWLEGERLILAPLDGSEPLAAVDLLTHVGEGRAKVMHLPPEKKMKYDFLNWLADRGRGFADQGLAPQWAGSGIEMMKEVYFKAQEVKADIAESTPEPEPVPVEAVEVVEEAIERARMQAEKSKLAWPPLPLEPMLEDRIQGEGLWKAVAPDRVTYQDNAPPPFFTTFLRPDPEYRKKRVWMAIWDPAQVSLKMRAGTSNPVPQTGHRGDGRIPRTADVLPRVVAGFNGGFQTAHIWYGMMVDKKVLLRPREYGATAGSWEDGRTAFGTWEPNAPIPDGLTHYRQNLPPLIEDGVFNPYRRRTWGWHKNVAGAVHGKTIRSSICYTYDGYVMYFYSEFQNEHGLANTLFHVGCRYAIHLDMNKGHTGFEFYKLLPEDATAPSDETAEVEGQTFRGTPLHPTIKHMKAPTRYLGVDYRDFFYLQLRDVIPGRNLSSLQSGDDAESTAGLNGHWSVDGLVHNAEFPRRAAWTTVAPRSDADGAAIEIVQLDPRAVNVTHTTGAVTPSPELMLSFPTREDSAGQARVRVGDLELTGSPLGAGNDTPTNALIAATDSGGFVWLMTLRDASTRDGRDLLDQRGLKGAVIVPLSSQRRILKYQRAGESDTDGGWIEAELSASDGNVLTTLTDDGPRLVVSAQAQPERIVRLFPDMRPKAQKTRKRKKRR